MNNSYVKTSSEPLISNQKSAKEKWVDGLLGKMNLEQKVGQLMVFGMCGTVITPDIVELITKYHIGGLRISQGCRIITMGHAVKMGQEPEEWVKRAIYYPEGNNKDYAYVQNAPKCSASEYADVLNRLRDYSLDRDLGIGLHFTIDQEGNNAELLSGQRLFPDQLGVKSSSDPELAYRIALCIGMQARALGVNMIHSPVLDVNTNPKNPEAGPRSYGCNPEDVVKYGVEALRGFQESGLIATGKHFPGRGESEVDSHFELPVVNIDANILRKVHIYPYIKMIEAGLPAIMIGHSIYPTLDPSQEPSSVSKYIINILLRQELGFEGIITTDNLMMAGLMKKYDICEASVLAIKAGCDLILFRDESPLRIRLVNEVVEAVKTGRLSEKRIEQSVARILAMRWDMGISQNGGKVNASKAQEPINSPFVMKTATEAAQKCTIVLRDKFKMLPLKSNKRVLLIEQIHIVHSESNNMYSHPSLLWEQLCGMSDNVYSVEIPFFPEESDCQRIKRRLNECDLIVMTNYFHPKRGKAISELVREVKKCGKPVIVITNNPFEFGAPPDFETVLVSFCPGGKENMRALAEILYGKLRPTATFLI